MEQPDGIGTAADAGNHRVGQRAATLEKLRARLATDDRLQLAHQIGIGVATDRGAQQIISAGRIRDPVAQCLIDGCAQRAIAARDGNQRRPEQPHAADIRGLPFHVQGAHVDRARKSDARAGRGARHSMLAGTGLGNDAPRAQPLGEQRLSQRVVDLMRAGMRKPRSSRFSQTSAPHSADRCGAGLSAVGRPTQSRSS